MQHFSAKQTVNSVETPAYGPASVQRPEMHKEIKIYGMLPQRLKSLRQKHDGVLQQTPTGRQVRMQKATATQVALAGISALSPTRRQTSAWQTGHGGNTILVNKSVTGPSNEDGTNTSWEEVVKATHTQKKTRAKAPPTPKKEKQQPGVKVELVDGGSWRAPRIINKAALQEVACMAPNVRKGDVG